MTHTPWNGRSIKIKLVCSILIAACILVDVKTYGQVPHFFKPNTRYVYFAYYINDNNDTLSVEKISVQNSGLQFEKAPKQCIPTGNPILKKV